MSNTEATQLGYLLLSNDDKNVLLALTMLERQPHQIKHLQEQAWVYYFFSRPSMDKHLQRILQGNTSSLYYMTQEGRELEGRELVKEWLDALAPDFSEQEHCLYYLTSHGRIKPNNLSKKEINQEELPSLERLQRDWVALQEYIPYIDLQAEHSAYYYRFAHYIQAVLAHPTLLPLSKKVRWEYQKIVLEYLRKAQEEEPQNTKIAHEISCFLHHQCPVEIVARDHAQEVIDNYLMAAYIPDPTAPMCQFVASFYYIELADFYRDVLQQALSAHHYYEKSLQLAPSNEQAKLEWAKLLEKEGATARARALRVSVNPDYEAPSGTGC